MSLLMFHSGNVPFTLNEDMVVRDLKIASTDGNGFEFQSTEVETQQLAKDIIDGKVDGIKLVMDLTALRSPSTPEGTHIVGFPYYHLDFDNQKLTIKVNNSGIQMPTDDGVQIIDYITIYANGNLDIGLLDRQ